ncbi:MAG: hypothetical protein PHF21_03340 [Bacilli bacterium]|nr:hypothetical protein [Bacilli bacterium]
MKKIIEDKYFKLGLTIFLIVAACISFFFIIYKFNMILDKLFWVIKLFTPFIIGFTFAYLLNPLVVFFEKLALKLFLNKTKLKKSSKEKLSRFLGITIICSFTIGLLILTFSFIIPELLNSIESLIMNMPGYLETTKNY